MFLRPLYASSDAKDAQLLFLLFDEVVVEVGVHNVVHGIIDNASNYVAGETQPFLGPHALHIS
jgi:hypothetical protein